MDRNHCDRSPGPAIRGTRPIADEDVMRDRTSADAFGRCVDVSLEPACLASLLGRRGLQLDDPIEDRLDLPGQRDAGAVEDLLGGALDRVGRLIHRFKAFQRLAHALDSLVDLLRSWQRLSCRGKPPSPTAPWPLSAPMIGRELAKTAAAGAVCQVVLRSLASARAPDGWAVVRTPTGGFQATSSADRMSLVGRKRALNPKCDRSFRVGLRSLISEYPGLLVPQNMCFRVSLTQRNQQRPQKCCPVSLWRRLARPSPSGTVLLSLMNGAC